MRIAILGSRGFPSTYGGYETLVRYLARFLVAEGHEVTVYCRDREGGRRVWATEGVRCIATPGLDTKSLSTISYGATATCDALFRKFDAVLVLNIANGFWLRAFRARRIPVAVNTDGIEWERGKWGRVGRNVFKVGAFLTARHANELIADSQEIGRIWRERFGVGSTFIPYGAPVLNDVSADRLGALGLKTGSYALVVARLIPENNVDLALDAIDHLGELAPPLVIVGSANFKAPIVERLRTMSRAGRVQWLGHVADQTLLTELWGNCGVYIHGHSVGGTNPALLQAMGAGAPVLALDTAFNREVVERAEQLFPNDASALAIRIRAVLDREEERAVMSSYGRDRVASAYDWNVVCANYRDVLAEIAHRTPPLTSP